MKLHEITIRHVILKILMLMTTLLDMKRKQLGTSWFGKKDNFERCALAAMDGYA